MSPIRLLGLACLFWIILVAAGVGLRPALPVDETRYFSVAWEMWLRNDFLVPHLNGETYSHKPPLLFWGMNAGWALFGVNDVTPRLIAPLFGLFSLILTFRLARAVWPGEAAVAGYAPMLLIGTLFWSVFTSLTLFDMMLTAAALLANLGFVLAWRRGGAWGFVLAGLGAGAGFLAKGPVVLLHVLPVALLAPLWAPRLPGYSRAMSWAAWYGGVALVVAVGAAIGLAWAIPAGIAGGEEYRNAIFWGQSAGRVVNSFDHARPIWWYLAALPPILLPWLIWPSAWRAARRGGRLLMDDGGVRLCLVWFIAAFLSFSVISGKQLHYLLPEFPPLALIIAAALNRARQGGFTSDAMDRWSVGLFFIVMGAAAPVAAYLDLFPGNLPVGDTAETYPMFAAAAAALIFLVRAPSKFGTGVTVIALLSVITVTSLHLSLRPALQTAYDQRAFSEAVQKYERQGYDIAFIDTYHNTFHFLGRLKKPFHLVSGGPFLEAFARRYPKSKVISYRTRHAPLEAHEKPDAVGRFRSGHFVLWDVRKHMNDLEAMARR